MYKILKTVHCDSLHDALSALETSVQAALNNNATLVGGVGVLAEQNGYVSAFQAVHFPVNKV